MPDGVILFDRAYFDSAEWLNQKNAADGFGRGAAWLDLLALANQKAATMEIRGLRIPIERGQCGRSKLGLAQRWGYGQGKVHMLLAHWEKIGRLKMESGNDTTIISILNFDDWQTALAGMVSEQTVSKSGTDREQIVTEKEKDREKVVPRGIGEGGEPGRPPAEIPDDETIRSFAQSWPGDMARGIPAGIPEVWWSGWVANRLNDEKKWPRDWQRALVLAFRADFLNRHPKALAQTAAIHTGNGGSLSANVAAIQSQVRTRELAEKIRALEDELHRDRLGNLPRQPEKTAELKKLRGELAELELSK